MGGFSGKGAILAEGLLYTGDAAFYRRELEQMVALTPADVQAAMQRWLSRPAYNLTVLPGMRTLDGATMGGWGDEASTPPPAPDAGGGIAPAPTEPPRVAPAAEPVGELTFPEVKRATLSNGIEVRLAQRSAIPKVTLAITFDAGSAVDPVGRKGVHETMIDLLNEGTTTKSALEIAIAQEELGSSISLGAGVDNSAAYLTTLSTNLAPSLDLLADVLRRPAFAPADVARVRQQRLAQVAQELGVTRRNGAARDAPADLWRGSSLCRGIVSRRQRRHRSDYAEDMAAEHATWIRPELASITAVGDVTMADLVAALEASFGDWQAPDVAVPAKTVDQPSPAPAQRLVVIDRPNSPSSYLLLSRLAPFSGAPEGIETIEVANEVLGSGFLSRLMGDLRETKGWTYGISSGFAGAKGPRSFAISTEVQADRTADSIRAIIAQMAAYPGHPSGGRY